MTEGQFKLTPDMIETEYYRIRTVMGKLTTSKLPFLNSDEINEFNIIGYTGKNSKDEKISQQDYLNSLGKGVINMLITQFDTGDFIEEYIIVRINVNELFSEEWEIRK